MHECDSVCCVGCNVFWNLLLWCSPGRGSWPLGSCSTESHLSQFSSVKRVGFLQPDCASAFFFPNPRLKHLLFLGTSHLYQQICEAPKIDKNPKQVLFGPSVVFVLGGPGAGKGTQCSRIAVGSHGARRERWTCLWVKKGKVKEWASLVFGEFNEWT